MTMNGFGTRRILTCVLSASWLLLTLFSTRLAASSLTLAWDFNREPDLAGYNIYYGTRSRDYDSVIDVGNVTQYKIRGLAPETQYYFALTAYDTSWNESDFSPEVSAVTGDEPVGSPSPQPGLIGGGGSGGGGCFIATAAYGSYLDHHVKVLRDFRAKFLVSNPLGRRFVRLYYQYSPSIASRIEKHGFVQCFIRQALLPVIAMSSLSLQTTASQKLLLLPLCLLLGSFIVFRPYFLRSR